MSGKRVCVIGAGPAGCSVIIQFQNLAKSGVAVPEVVCYEKQEGLGGLWRYTWRTGVDQYGQPVTGSMYRDLWSNGPKECLEYGDYTFMDHFKKPIGSYPPRTALIDYLEGRARKFGIENKINFNHTVKSVTYDANSKTFSVTVKNLLADTCKTERFDYVIVCGGHFSTPNVPDFPGIETFPGRVIHSHDFRDARQFAGQRVLAIGGSYSAEDVASQVYKFGAKHATVSARRGCLGFKWPEAIDEKPGIEKIDRSTVTFKDGTSMDYDSIVICTGYYMDYWYMADDLKLRGYNPMYGENLYKGIIWMPAANNQLFYMGDQDHYYSYTMFDVEAFYVVKVITGQLKLPSRSEMEADYRKWKTRCDNLKDCFDDIRFQTDYMLDLKELSGYKYPLDCAEQFNQWEHHKFEDIMTFREKGFPSIHTGVTGAPLKSWVTQMSDKLEDYVNLF